MPRVVLIAALTCTILSIGYLEHENLAVRDLAYRQLAALAPGCAKRVPYDPAGTAEQRPQAVARWRELVPPGKQPPG